MFKKRGPSALIAALATTALVATACGGGGDEGSGGDTGAGAKGGQYSTNISEPDALGPHSKCYASECGQVLSVLYAGLVDMNNQGELIYRIAKSIESEDQVHWTIKLKKGWTFHNGKEVTANDYIRAWNWAAYGPNAADTNGFFSVIKGYDKMNSSEEGVSPETTELAGLEKVDKYTFKVTLNAPFSQFKYSLLYTNAFGAQLQSCFEDENKCNNQPIGTGPYQIVKWTHDQEVVVKRYEDYKGKNKGNAEKIVFKIYASYATAFNAWRSGDLDIMNEPLPENVAAARRLADERIIEATESSISYLGIPQYNETWEPKMVKALSMAINRKAVIKNTLAGLGQPAKAWVPPDIPGGGRGICGSCTYNPEKAKQLMKEAGGLPVDTITLWFNSGAGHKGWVTAIANSWRRTFGVDYQLKTPQFADYLDALEQHEITGPFRLGWLKDYPSMVNFLKPIYFSGFPSNYTGFNNKKFEELVRKGNAADSQQEAIKWYTEAEKILAQEMPSIPVYFGEKVIVWNESLAKVPYSKLSTNPDFEDVVVANVS